MRIGRPLVLMCLGYCLANTVRAQDLVPRAYAISVVDTNVFLVNSSHLDGGVQFNGAVPITGARADINVPVLSYYHSFDVLGHLANFTFGQPYGFGEFRGTVADVPKSAYRTGFLDTYARLAVMYSLVSPPTALHLAKRIGIDDRG